MEREEIDTAVRDSRAAVQEVSAEREALRWRVKPGDADRERRLRDCLETIDRAMRPLRSLIGRLVWEPIPRQREDALRQASQRLQYERRQIKKMRRQR